MPEPRESTTNRAITIRYLIALGLIATVLIVSHLLLHRQISRSSSDGFTINIAGMQRMLSQRIALMANELATSDDDKTAALMFKKFDAATKKMASNQTALDAINEKRISPEMKDLCYGDQGMHPEVDNYLALADQLRQQYQQDPNSKIPQQQTAHTIAKIARNGFLNRLDQVVSQYQIEDEQRIATFQWFEMIVLLIGLSLLILEAIFIFRPMTKQITTTVNHLENANGELREFAYRISHDLRAPVASSLGLSDIVKESILENDLETAVDGTDRLKNAMSKLDGLISDIITVTKNRHIKVDPEPIELASMVHEILDNHSNLPKFDQLKVTTELDSEQRLVSKRVFVKQSLENLISNAIKYSDPDEETPELRIKSTTEGGNCTIEISDNGIGIPTECRRDIFGMFKRFHPRHSFGSGLGLYLVKQNLNAVDGTIEYKPLAKGTSFLIRIPQTKKGV
ncbi:ATP-binding protein [bacterium]|nr:ATP-binding protein [bacterium]